MSSTHMRVMHTRHEHTHTLMSTCHTDTNPHVATWQRSATSARGDINPFFILFNHLKIENTVKQIQKNSRKFLKIGKNHNFQNTTPN